MCTAKPFVAPAVCAQARIGARYATRPVRAFMAAVPSTISSFVPSAPSPWLELASQWQQTLQLWSQWWLGGGAPCASGASQALPPPRRSVRSGRLAALNERFRPRFEALWGAAQAALAQPGSVMPDIVPTPKHDRRFASAAWREQPYFSYLRQAYLLYAEYLARSPTSRRCRRSTSSACASRRANTSTRSRRRIFPATNPDVLAARARDRRREPRAGPANLCQDAAQGPHHDERRVGLRGRPQSRRHARQRRVPQRADRAHPVRRDDAHGPPPAARHGAAVHQQVLHPRSHARRTRSCATRWTQGTRRS